MLVCWPRNCCSHSRRFHGHQELLTELLDNNHYVRYSKPVFFLDTAMQEKTAADLVYLSWYALTVLLDHGIGLFADQRVTRPCHTAKPMFDICLGVMAIKGLEMRRGNHALT